MDRPQCKTCLFYSPDYGVWCVNGWSRDGSTGQCSLDHVFDGGGRVPVFEDHWCRYWRNKDNGKTIDDLYKEEK